MTETSAADVFRFVQLRPPLQADPGSMIALAGGTNISEMMRNARSAQSRADGARAYLQSGDAIRHVDAAFLGSAIAKAIAELRTVALRV